MLLVSTVVGAQGPYPAADFARLGGTWELDGLVGAPGFRPSGESLRFCRPSGCGWKFSAPRTLAARWYVIQIDGQDVTNAFGEGGGDSRLLREGGAYVTETIYEIRSSPITVRETLNVNSEPPRVYRRAVNVRSRRRLCCGPYFIVQQSKNVKQALGGPPIDINAETWMPTSTRQARESGPVVISASIDGSPTP